MQVIDPAVRVVDVSPQWAGPQQGELDLTCLMPGVYNVRVQLSGVWRTARQVKQ